MVVDAVLGAQRGGDALQLRKRGERAPGSTHAIRQSGEQDLVLLITYGKPATR